MWKDRVRARGYTLVELLVVVAIIAVLVSLLLPALRNARGASYVAGCASNLRQIGVAWWVYLNDSDGEFPMAPQAISLQWAYGGRHPSLHLKQYQMPQRPLNPYMDGRLINDPGSSVFRCPADRGFWNRRTGGEGTFGNTAFDYFGTSYPANGVFFRRGTPANDPRRRAGVSLREIEVPYSRLFLAGDPGTMVALGVWDAEFHADDNRENVMMLDGHVSYLRLLPFGHGGTDGDPYMKSMYLPKPTR